jgi:hypothetical protein
MEKEATSAVCQQISDLIDGLDAFAKSAWGVKYETDLKVGLRMTLFGGGQIVITRSANGKLDVKVGRNQKGGNFLVLAQKGNVPDKKLVLVVDELLDARSKKGDLHFAAAIQWDTPAFKAWFQGSKMVDAEGNPQRYFHGTNKDFDTFQTEPWGAYFTTKDSVFKNYARGENGRVVPVYLSIKNPASMKDLREVSAALRAADPGRDVNNQDYIRELKAKGFDGLVTMGGGHEVIVFDANQIKSAIGNNGEFDPTNPKITAKQGALATDSPAFKSWFAGSKIVDAQGEPLVATHTSPVNWDIFDKTKTRSGSVWGPGIYLSLNEKTWNASGNAITLHLYVKCVDPLDLTKPVSAETLERMGQYLGRTLNPDNGIPLISLERKAGSLTAAAEAMGFDGILHQGPGSHGLHLVVFQPNQIKSATDNSGAYDPNDNRITAASDFKAQLNALKPKLAQAAQQVYDKWDASDEVDGDFNVGFGGICHLIADAMAEVIEENIPGAATTTLSHDSMVHVSVVAWDEATEEPQEDDDPDEPRWIDLYHVDIYPYFYETGGGYNWQKIPDVQFDASFVSISRDRISPEDLEALREG